MKVEIQSYLDKVNEEANSPRQIMLLAKSKDFDHTGIYDFNPSIAPAIGAPYYELHPALLEYYGSETESLGGYPSLEDYLDQLSPRSNEVTHSAQWHSFIKGQLMVLTCNLGIPKWDFESRDVNWKVCPLPSETLNGGLRRAA